MKKILLSASIMMSVAAVNAQITNGDLDNWTAGEPVGWLYDFGTGPEPGTNNWVVALGEGDPATTTEIAGSGGTGSALHGRT